jgi:hypothetical protein
MFSEEATFLGYPDGADRRAEGAHADSNFVQRGKGNGSRQQ